MNLFTVEQRMNLIKFQQILEENVTVSVKKPRLKSGLLLKTDSNLHFKFHNGQPPEMQCEGFVKAYIPNISASPPKSSVCMTAQKS